MKNLSELEQLVNKTENTTPETATAQQLGIEPATTTEATVVNAEAGVWRELYEQQGRELAELKQVAAAARFNSALSTVDQNIKPSMTVERAKALAGPDAWYRMTEAQRLAAIGQDINTVDRDLLKRTFGRGSDSRLGQDLFKTSALKYRLQKEAAICLGLYAA
jgi:hypothetical protein